MTTKYNFTQRRNRCHIKTYRSSAVDSREVANCPFLFDKSGEFVALVYHTGNMIVHTILCFYRTGTHIYHNPNMIVRTSSCFYHTDNMIVHTSLCFYRTGTHIYHNPNMIVRNGNINDHNGRSF